MESSEHEGTYVSPPTCTNQLILERGLFHLVLSGYSNLSHNFTNLVFLTSSLLFSIIQVIMVCDLKNTVSRY